MKLGKVIGAVVSTIKNPSFNNLKLLVIQPLDGDLKETGRTHPAVDMVGAGVGDTVVIVEEGRAARAFLGTSNAPIRTLIVGIVDEVQRG